MSDENIFDGTETPVIVEPTPNLPVLSDPLKELIGEGKKYASVDLALASLPHAQAHITKIEQENAEMRQKVAEAMAVEEVYKKLMESKPDGATTPTHAVVDEASIASLVDRRLAEKAANEIASANITRVKEALVGKFGDKAQEAYEAKAKELGVGVAFLNEVVKRSPKAAEELFGISGKSAPAAPVKGSVDTSFLNSNRPVATQKHSPLAGGDLMSAWRSAKEAVNNLNKE